MACRNYFHSNCRARCFSRWGPVHTGLSCSDLCLQLFMFDLLWKYVSFMRNANVHYAWYVYTIIRVRKPFLMRSLFVQRLHVWFIPGIHTSYTHQPRNYAYAADFHGKKCIKIIEFQWVTYLPPLVQSSLTCHGSASKEQHCKMVLDMWNKSPWNDSYLASLVGLIWWCALAVKLTNWQTRAIGFNVCAINSFLQ